MNSFPKPVKVRSLDRRKFASERGCILQEDGVCQGLLDAHHVAEDGQGSTGSKPPDDRTLGLCRLHHSVYHSIGKESFALAYGLDFDALLSEINREYALLPRGTKQRKERQAKSKLQRIFVECSCGEIHRLAPSKVTFEETRVKYFCIRRREYGYAAI